MGLLQDEWLEEISCPITGVHSQCNGMTVFTLDRWKWRHGLFQLYLQTPEVQVGPCVGCADYHCCVHNTTLSVCSLGWVCGCGGVGVSVCACYREEWR